ncbi:PAS domain S-box protein [bacterium]|nr:PAS domain S-box protein [bacterium]
MKQKAIRKLSHRIFADFIFKNLVATVFFLAVILCCVIPEIALTQTQPEPSSSLSIFLSKSTKQTEKLHQELFKLAENAETKNTLMISLEHLLAITNQKAKTSGLTPYSAVAAFSPDDGWLAWSGSFSAPPNEWMYLGDNQTGEIVTYLFESPAQSNLITCSLHENFSLLSSQTIAVTSDLSIANTNTLLEGISRHTGFTAVYKSPFQSLPGAFLLDNNLQSDLSFISLIDKIISSDYDESESSFILKLTTFLDPQFYAGDLPFLPSAGHMLLFGLVLWIASSFLRIYRINGKTRFFFLPFSAAGIYVCWSITSLLSVSLIENTNSAWWPDFQGEFGWASIILPLSALLLTGAMIRIILWSILLWIPLSSKQDRTICKKSVPGWFVLALTILLLAPLFIKESESTIRENLSSSLTGWIHERENLLQLALESNLEKLNKQPDYSAWQAWNKCDLNVLNVNYGIEILDSDGLPVDRFSPFFTMYPVSPEILSRFDQGQKQTLILPGHALRQNLRSPLVGISRFNSDSNSTSGYIVIQIPAGPGSIKPEPGQWGERVLLFSASGGGNPYWPDNSPIPFKTQWFDSPPDPPVWIRNETGHYDIFLLKLPNTDINQPELIFAVLPRLPITAHLAGIARLGLLSLLLILPGLFYREIKHLVFSGSDEYHGSYTHQLLAAFILPVIVLPLVFAATLHGIIQETESSHHASQMTHLLNRTMTNLKNQVLMLAMRKQSEIEQQLLKYDAVINDSSGESWLILDGQGRPVISSLVPLSSNLPLNSITQVYQTFGESRLDAWNISFELLEPGILVGQVVLPYPISIHLMETTNVTGTFVCEIPLTGKVIQTVGDPADLTVDLYGDGMICASNRPELFNTGVLPTQLSGSAYRELSIENKPFILKMDRRKKIYKITGAINNINGQRIAAIRITPGKSPVNFPGAQPEDWLYITTVILLIAGFLLSIFFGRRLAGPIQALTQGARKVAAGHLDSRVKVMGIGETKMLTQTFNSMISDLEQKRSDLEERHTFISTLLAQMSSTIIAIDNNARILTVNRSFERLFKHNNNNLIGRNVFHLLTELGIPEISAALKSWLDNASKEKLVTKLLRKGQTIHIVTVFVALESNDGRKGTLIVLEDITSTVQSSKLQAYGDLARRIAHEVKNPLTPIQLSIEHLQQAWEDGAENFPDIFDTCMNMVLSEVGSLEKIASEFSRFARFPKPVFQISDIRDLLQEVLMMYHGTPDGIEIHLKCDDQALFCRFDRDQMKRVFINLCQNALQAMEKGGLLLLEGKSDRDWIILSISDTGRGMDEETLLHLFEPYFSTKKEGAGLGLVITKAVINAHDGDIQVESSPEIGTTFTIKLAKTGIPETLKSDTGTDFDGE